MFSYDHLECTGVYLSKLLAHIEFQVALLEERFISIIY